MSIGFTFKAKTRKIDALKESVKEMAEESGYGLDLNEKLAYGVFLYHGRLVNGMGA